VQLAEIDVADAEAAQRRVDRANYMPARHAPKGFVSIVVIQ
jgi:hypothetical protein